MTDIQVKLTEFSDLITRYTVDFVGRGWLVEQVQALLEEPDCRFVVLTGGPGVGKTAFMAHLAATHPQWPRYFIRRDSRDLLRPGDANTFLLTIGGQLATLYPHLFHPENLEVVVRQRIGSLKASGEATAVRIDELRASPFYSVALRVEQEIRQVAGKAAALEIGRLVSEPRLLQMQDLQYLGLLDPARLLLQTDPEARIVVLVDALDELRYSPAEPDILRVLRELPEVPPNLRFLISSRPEAFLGRLLARSDAKELPLDVAGADNWTDLRTYAEGAIGGDGLKPVLEREGLNPEAFVDGLLDKATGNFLYLKSVLSGIQQALEDPAKRERLSHLLRVEELPGALGRLYGYFLSFIVDWVTDSLDQDAWQKYLRPFLGVLAVAQEPLSEEQIIAFTDLKREAIRDLQRELRQFVETVDSQSPAYRIYHASFAVYLLDSEQNRDYWIDGRERHNCIADCYLNAWGGLEASLPGLQDPAKRDLDDGYGLRHLAAHLEGAERTEDLHRLLALETSERRNAWYEAREAMGDTDGFLADVTRAWRLAEGVYSPADSTHMGQSIGLQCRYGLITASISSLATNCPPALLVTLVEKGIWSPARGVAYAQRIAEPNSKVQALIGLAPHSSELLLRETQKMVREIGDDSGVAEAIIGIAPYLPESLLREMLDVARVIGTSTYRIKALTGLVPHLSEPLRSKALRAALDSAREVGNESEQVVALTNLVPHLSEPLLSETLSIALETARRIENGSEQVKTMTALAPYLSDPLRGEILRDALEDARKIENGSQQVEALARLVPHLSEPLRNEILREAMGVAQALHMPSLRAMGRATLIPYMPDSQREDECRRAVEGAQGEVDPDDRASALSELAEIWTKFGYLKEALVAVQAIGHFTTWATALARLAPHLPDSLRDDVLRRALAEVRINTSTDVKATMLARLAPQISSVLSQDEILHEAWAATIAIKDRNDRMNEMRQLAPYLPLPLLPEALQTVSKIDDEYWQVKMLVVLAPHLPEPLRSNVLREVLAATRAIVNERERTESLIGLALQLPEPLRGEAFQAALDAARTIEYGQTRAEMLTKLAPHLPEPLLRKMLTVVYEIDYKSDRVKALIGLVPYLLEPMRSEALREAFATASAIEYKHLQLESLSILVPHLIEPLRGKALRKALSVARETGSAYRADALIRLIPCLPEALRDKASCEALAAVREIEYQQDRPGRLIRLAPCLSQPLLREALKMACELRWDGWISKTLAGLSPYLSGPLLQEALATVQELADKHSRADALIGLGLYLPETLQGKAFCEALAVAREIDDDHNRKETLINLIPHLSGLLLQEVLTVAREFDSEQYRSEILTELALHLPESLREEVIREALAVIRDGYSPQKVLIRLAPHLSKPLLREALDVACEINDSIERARALIGLIHHLSNHVPINTLYGIWCDVLHTLTSRTRKALLSDLQALCPVIISLGSQEAASEIFRAIQDVGRWWP